MISFLDISVIIVIIILAQKYNLPTYFSSSRVEVYAYGGGITLKVQ